VSAGGTCGARNPVPATACGSPIDSRRAASDAAPARIVLVKAEVFAARNALSRHRQRRRPDLRQNGSVLSEVSRATKGHSPGAERLRRAPVRFA
jgi:hypothetical protein